MECFYWKKECWRRRPNSTSEVLNRVPKFRALFVREQGRTATNCVQELRKSLPNSVRNGAVAKRRFKCLPCIYKRVGTALLSKLANYERSSRDCCHKSTFCRPHPWLVSRLGSANKSNNNFIPEQFSIKSNRLFLFFCHPYFF